jgi:hypothetical protein
MNNKDIRKSSDPDLAGSLSAIQRAARSAENLAIQTNTGIVVSVDGQSQLISARELLEMRELEAHKSGDTKAA